MPRADRGQCWLALLPLLFLAGCADRRAEVVLSYAQPSLRLEQAVASVAVAQVVDERRLRPNYLGAVRDSFGIPMQVLSASEPVQQAVGRAFAEALAARGMRAEAGG